MQAPVIIKQIPNQGVNERAAFGPFDLKEYIQAPDGSAVEFRAELADSASLPKGLICTENGIVTGIPAKDTQGNHEIVITARNDVGSVQAKFVLAITPSLARRKSQADIDEMKNIVWQALEHNQQLPELAELLDRAITPLDIYYLLERWGTLTIYDAFNLDSPGKKTELQLEGMNKHYHIYDRGCCLVSAPKDLFSH